jgi:hypothetical protein
MAYQQIHRREIAAFAPIVIGVALALLGGTATRR